MLRLVRHASAARSRLALAVLLAALAAAACGERPPVRLTPAPQPVDSSFGVPLSEAQEKVVLNRLQPLLPALVRRHWGLPPDSVAWRLRVDVDRDRLDQPVLCRDTLVVPTARERRRARFCRDLERALGPTDTADVRFEGPERVLDLGRLVTRNDTIWAIAILGATQRCAGGRWNDEQLYFHYHFVRRRGRWQLVSETPELNGGGPGPGSDSTCVPQPRHLWEQPPPGPPPGSRPPRDR